MIAIGRRSRQLLTEGVRRLSEGREFFRQPDKEVGREIGSGRKIFQRDRSERPDADEKFFPPPDVWDRMQKEPPLGILDTSTPDPVGQDRFNKYIEQMMKDSDQMMESHSRKLITGYSRFGFTLGTTLRFEQSILVMPDGPLLWNVKHLKDVNPESLAVLDVVFPRPDTLVIGCEDDLRHLSRATVEYLRTIKVSVECMITSAALNTYNVIVQDGRSCACGLIVPYEDAVIEPKTKVGPRDSVLQHRDGSAEPGEE